MALRKRIRFLRLNVPRWMFMAFLCAIGLYILVEVNIKPVIIGLAEARVRAVAVTAMNDTVMGALRDEIKYSDLMEVKYDDSGNITMIQANTIAINKIASEITKAAQESIGEISILGVDVPAGSILGGQLFAGKGPVIHVSVIPAGSVNSQFKSEFTSAGINQTRHRIILEMSINMKVVAPVGSSSIQAVTQIPVAETIIVGKVPECYVNVDETADMLNLLPID